MREDVWEGECYVGKRLCEACNLYVVLANPRTVYIVSSRCASSVRQLIFSQDAPKKATPQDPIRGTTEHGATCSVGHWHLKLPKLRCVRRRCWQTLKQCSRRLNMSWYSMGVVLSDQSEGCARKIVHFRPHAWTHLTSSLQSLQLYESRLQSLTAD